MKINKLSQKLIDQIAAGEIVERPASIVKELIENSIDAGAGNISVKLIDGGSKSILVTDNGFGIEKNDLLLAIENHATSKISTQEDFENCLSHGFRGEALAAISSVANIKIRSKVQFAEKGYELVKPSGSWEIYSSPGDNGTDIVVENLFHNLPARKRFLKNNRTEFKHCQSIFTQLSLVYPDVEFSLSHQGIEVTSLKKSSGLARFANVFGLSEEQVVVYSERFGELDIELYISASQEVVKKPPHFFYVNNRPIKNVTISYAIKNAFKNRVHELHTPYLLLFIAMRNEYINFNVHPGKKEVHFRNNNVVYNAVYRILCRALSTNDLRGRKNELTFSETSLKHNDSIVSKSLSGFDQNQNQDGFPKLEQRFTELSLFEKPNHDNAGSGLGHPICHLNNIYILAQNVRGLIIVDAHAAHERILLEDLKKNDNLRCQKLSIPECIEFNEIALPSIKNRIEIINNYGFQVKVMNETTLVIEGIPEILVGRKHAIALREIADGILSHGNICNVVESIDEILGNIACKSAIKANQKLTLAEMEYILRRIESVNNGGICNHGRPTWTELSMETLDKLFSRGK